MQKKILVVVVTYNGIKWIHHCLKSIEFSNQALECLVIDNGSNDGTQDFILNNFPKVIFIQSEVNLGFGKANNIGLKFALEHGYDYVYLLNQDAWITPHTIDKLIEIHEKYNEYGILSPFQLQANSKALDNNFAQLVCSFQSNRELISDLYSGTTKQVYSVPFVMAAHWLISKECLNKVGGFSPSFPHYGEDDNYIDRALYHGFKVGIVPEAIAIHDREDRKISREKQMYLNYTYNLVLCSKFNITNINKIRSLIKNTLVSSIHNRSFVPFKYMMKIIFSWNKIMENLEISKYNETAFIK